MPRRFHIATFGCRTNQADTAILRDDFLQQDYLETDDAAQADVIVVNSCTVTHRSDQQVRQTVRRLRRDNRDARLMVTGCYAQRDPETLARIDGVDAVVGNTHKNRLVEISMSDSGPVPVGPRELARIYREEFGRVRTIDTSQDGESRKRTRPFVKIQDGCDARCSYCIIPSVRGPSRSVSPHLILEQIRSLVDLGYREVVLTGIHMGTYGLHQSPRFPLHRLLERILEIGELQQLRISSIEPMQLSKRVIRLAAENAGRIAPHFHICLQSGSDRTLKRMRRPYNTKQFAEIAQLVRDHVSDAGIGTDIITGFPGETEEDHRQSFEFVASLPFTYLHVFPYSDRSGTEAAGMPDKVHPEDITDRSKAFRRLSLEKNRKFRQSFLGRKISAITLDEIRDGRRTALTGNYLKAVAPATIPPNRILDLEAVGMDDDYLILE